jgi:aminoglycoside 3-N-acetyltransferase
MMEPRLDKAESELCAAYDQIGLTQGATVLVTAPEAFEIAPYLDALRQVIGPSGTLVADSATPSLLNSGAPFDAALTPAENPVGETARCLPAARRSLHPFHSFTAQGPQATALMDNAGPHELGPETPPGRLVASDALAVTVGSAPQNLAGRLAQFVMAVPYMYTREVLHPVICDRASAVMPFYLYVPYPDIGLEHDGGAALFERVCVDGLALRSTEIAGVTVTAWRLAEFYRLACAALRTDLYLGCTSLPRTQPYRQ